MVKFFDFLDKNQENKYIMHNEINNLNQNDNLFLIGYPGQITYQEIELIYQQIKISNLKVRGFIYFDKPFI